MFHVEQSKNKINNPTLYNKYTRFLDRFRTEHIPKRYNQVRLLEDLTNENIDHYISISNRTDGKSFNYIHALINIAIEFDIGLMFLSRNAMLRVSYQELIEEIIDKSTVLERKDFTFIRTTYYIRIDYKGQSLALVSDLNNATELKYFSNFIKYYSLIVYDEFLAIESDYLPDEWVRLKTIYESIDRLDEYPLIKKPKIFYLGNAVNFSSPILSNLSLFNKMENHPMNTKQIYGNIALEMNRNENANEVKNTRAFATKEDAMTTGQFKLNPHTIANEHDRNRILTDSKTVTVKLHNEYLEITYNRQSFETLLSIKRVPANEYSFNTRLQDNKKDSTFIDESYYSETHYKKYDRGIYLFDNNYSRDYITSSESQFVMIKINKIIRQHELQTREQSQGALNHEQFTQNYLEQTKQSIMRKFLER